ncbi:hypothetical protein DVA67_031275 [Solirubrobacter sp. CPCC 204708]|uniref:SHOCT domain-containing protein n=1 Tax=Solirubrobacter deserti TaxID=2282478 RepID=A0ABT4RQE2_9ACTN|nr:SHOCT domain-containing protein [Solirubrobacter deserti]MBE2320486.1 hypothetical protein [Solirubrobacter deserti]MDA0140732.1 hypothetical protein [Solirubrobacter deserti]
MLIRTTIGLGAAAGGLSLMTYGIAQAIENGSCGTDEYGNVLGAPCPDGFGEMIVLMILGAFVALAGAALASSLLRFILPAIIAVGAGVMLGILDVNENDTRPGLEIIAAVSAPMVLFTVPFVGRRRSHGHAVPQPAQPVAATFGTPPPRPQPAREPTFEAPAPQWQPRTAQDPEDIAARLRQLDQLKASGLLDDAAYDEQRKRILSEL